jgi:hypothetical protein
MKNPPAFPLHNHGTQTLGLHITGMTLRDYFAAKAMQAILTHPESNPETPAPIFAKVSYVMADAMLKAREA